MDLYQQNPCYGYPTQGYPPQGYNGAKPAGYPDAPQAWYSDAQPAGYPDASTEGYHKPGAPPAGSSTYGYPQLGQMHPYSQNPDYGYPQQSCQAQGYNGAQPAGYTGSQPSGYDGKRPAKYPGVQLGGFPVAHTERNPGASQAGCPGTSQAGYPRAPSVKQCAVYSHNGYLQPEMVDRTTRYPVEQISINQVGTTPVHHGQPRFYFIKCRLNDLVLDVQGSNEAAKTRVIAWYQSDVDDPQENQLFYDDPTTGTIRCKLNGMCLHLEGNGVLVIDNYKPGNPSQMWERAGQVIRNRQMPQRVLEITGGRRETSTTLGAEDYNGGLHQIFDYVFVKGSVSTAPTAVTDNYRCDPLNSDMRGREFYIESKMHGKVMAVKEPSETAPVVVEKKATTRQKNQLWYIDQEGHIRSSVFDLMMKSNGSEASVNTGRYQPGLRKYFRIDGNKVVAEENGEVLDVRGASKKDGAEVITYMYKGSENQHWKFVQV